jgi:hypothetical protein
VNSVPRSILLQQPCATSKPDAVAALQAAHEVDDVRNSAAKTEAEATGLRAALEAARNRHFEQLTK